MLPKILALLGKPGYRLLLFLAKILEKGFLKLKSDLTTKPLAERLKNFSKKAKYIFIIPLLYGVKIILYFLRVLAGLIFLVIKQFILKLREIVVEARKKRVEATETKRARTVRIKKSAKKRSLSIEKKRKIAFGLTFLGIILMITGAIINLFKDLPSPDRLIEKDPPLTTKIYDRSKILLYKIYREQNRSLVPLEKIPPYMIQATLAIEDKNFYNHNGLSWKGILRAIRHNLFYPEKPQIGGSTITQQLVKNSLLNNEKTLKRKIREAILAVMVESKFSKDEIFRMYFNEIPYGGTAYGIEEASQKYFDKHVWEINTAEAAFLAGLTRAPSKYSPFGPYPEFAKKRQEQVVGEMVKSGYLTPEQAIEIIATPLRFTRKQDPIKAPHFVFYIKELLAETYGTNEIEQKGLEVVTTLDWKTQQMAEETVEEEIAKLTPLKIGNGAVLVVKPKTGEILAMVGSKDYFDFENDGNVNVVLRPRQPGSAIKPINYATALDKGYTAATIIPDTPITYRIPGQPPYSPKNYDNKFHGNISLRTALASSFNIPAVKVLSSYGVDQMIKTGERMGITTWGDTSRFGLSLTLGGGEIKMIDLAQAYSALANLGEVIPIDPLIQIKDHRGKTIYQNRCLSQSYCPGSYQAIKPGIAFILNDILSDNNARTLAFGPNSLLKISDHKVAAKTGTTNNLRDNWCFGYTPSILVAAWVGNNDNTPMSYVASGITGATPIWNKIIMAVLAGKDQEDWPRPEEVVKTPICRTTGTLPCQSCPKIVEEYFLKGSQPNQRCQDGPTPTQSPIRIQ
ncbi:MAG: transglycosylase domain-containing protein [Patescibacteria group bacterium]